LFAFGQMGKEIEFALTHTEKCQYWTSVHYLIELGLIKNNDMNGRISYSTSDDSHAIVINNTHHTDECSVVTVIKKTTEELLTATKSIRESEEIYNGFDTPYVKPFPECFNVVENSNDLVVKRHYYSSALNAHWLLIKQESEFIWEGFVLMPDFDENGEFGTVDIRELRLAEDLNQPHHKLLVGKFHDVVFRSNLFPKFTEANEALELGITNMGGWAISCEAEGCMYWAKAMTDANTKKGKLAVCHCSVECLRKLSI